MIKFEIDKNGFLTGNWAKVGHFENQVELDIDPNNINTNLRWDGAKLTTSFNPKQKETDLKLLRAQREEECFAVVNRGAVWYAMLSDEQKQELNAWYTEWLDITEKYQPGTRIETIIPKKPSWLK